MSDEDAKAEAAMAGDEEAGSKARKRGQSLIQEHKDDGKKEGGGGGGKKEEDQNRICVFARLRPVFKRDREDPTFEHIVNLQPDKKTISLTGGKTYVYDGTFGEKSEQVPVWVSVGKPVVENVFKGYCGCVMAYGQTGTGKSHTMSNMDRGQEGVVMQSMMHIFNKMENDTEREYDVLFSYLQIYLDKVQDLMSPASGNLDIVRSESGEVSIPGLVQKECRTRERFIELYEEGDQHRIVAATKMNPVSSRSHSCLMIQIKSKPRGDDGTGETRTAKMWMIDLAGYERFSKTGVLEGIRKEEAKGINASLLSLGNVIQALADKEKHIPWRNAKLTRLLQDAIGGKSKAAVCITLGPSGASFHETVGTLYFGSRAMAVKTEAKLQLNVDYAQLCKKLQAMLEEEQEKVSALEIQAETRRVEAAEREERMVSEIRRLKSRHEEQLKKLIESGADPTAIEALMKENEAEMELVQEQQAEERLLEQEKDEEVMKELIVEKEVVNSKEVDKLKEDHVAEVGDLRKKLEELDEEVARLKKKEEECGQLNSYITELKEEHSQELLRVKEETALNAGVSKDGLEQLKGGYDDQLKSIRTMMETTHEGRMAEADELHAKEIRQLKDQLRSSKDTSQQEYDQMKASLTNKYEDEITKIKAKAADVQDKLKRNHVIIKNSYQEQKERLKAEIKTLKDSHGGETAGMQDQALSDLRALTEKHQTIKKNYQDQVEKLKKENKALKEQVAGGAAGGGGGGFAPAAAAPAPADDDDEAPPGSPPQDDQVPDDE